MIIINVPPTPESEVIKMLQSSIALWQKECLQKSETIQQLQNRIDGYRCMLASRDAVIQDRQNKLSEKYREIESLTSRLEMQTEKVINLEKQLDEISPVKWFKWHIRISVSVHAQYVCVDSQGVRTYHANGSPGGDEHYHWTLENYLQVIAGFRLTPNQKPFAIGARNGGTPKKTKISCGGTQPKVKCIGDMAATSTQHTTERPIPLTSESRPTKLGRL
jgi:hypothetical protein